MISIIYKKKINEIKTNTKIIKNNYITEERNILLYKDDIKNFNRKINDIKNDKDSYIKSINLLNKHIVITKEKISKQNKNTNEFFQRLEMLAEMSKENNNMKNKFI